ncbi:MAG: hypothetical protein JSS39_14335 [Nitrospira sp.]|nr:hypothetical protein [Nitrospira sp.]
MGDLAIVVIWFVSVISGMLLTMLLPKAFADWPRDEVRQGEAVRASFPEMSPVEVFQGLRTSTVVIEEEV